MKTTRKSSEFMSTIKLFKDDKYIEISAPTTLEKSYTLKLPENSTTDEITLATRSEVVDKVPLLFPDNLSVYTCQSGGTTSSIRVDTENKAIANSIPYRDADGRIKAPLPGDDPDSVPPAHWVTSLLDTFRATVKNTYLPKVTTGGGIVYATGSTNSFLAIPWYTTNPVADSIPRRDSKGRLTAADAGTGGLDVVNNNIILRGRGVEYTHRNSLQTSVISNGRLRTIDEDEYVDGTAIHKQGQIEPMGLTVFYDTDANNSSENHPKQQTTVCINPNDVKNFVEPVFRVTLRLTENVVLSGDYGVTISLALMGYSNLMMGSITLTTEDGSSTDVGNLGNLSGDSFIKLAIGDPRIDYQNGLIYLDWASRGEVLRDYVNTDSGVTIEFSYDRKENYLYLPQKTGTLAVKEDLPKFELKGSDLYIYLPED